MAKAVFFDRDETLNPDTGYLNNPNHFYLYPWVIEPLARLKKAGFMLILVSNQSGIGRGHITWDQLTAIHEKLNRLLQEQAQIQLDDITVCPHSPDEECECRKPKPKLILEAAVKHNIDLNESFIIGDRESDYQAGKNAGLKESFLIKPGDEKTFLAAVDKILKS